MKKSNYGFTLIEIMIVLVIIAILAAVAIPAYQDSARKTRRSDAVTALEKAAAKQEQYYFRYNNYTTDVNFLGGTGGVGGSISSPEGYYRVTVATANNNQEYTLTATPVAGGPQASDTKCATFTLDELGVKGGTPAANVNTCWNR